jgi:hypothetical protein
MLDEEIKAGLVAHKLALLQRVAREKQSAELSTVRWGPGLNEPTPGNDIRGGAP